jgi:hypothetical protein
MWSGPLSLITGRRWFRTEWLAGNREGGPAWYWTGAWAEAETMRAMAFMDLGWCVWFESKIEDKEGGVADTDWGA